LCIKYTLSRPRKEWLNNIKLEDFKKRYCGVGRNEQTENQCEVIRNEQAEDRCEVSRKRTGSGLM
jgi:hypothetical protein